MLFIWNIKSQSKSRAKDHVDTLLSHLEFNIRFEQLEFTDRFIKIQLQDGKDKFSMLQGNKKLRENPFERGAGREYPYIYMTDDVTKGIRDIRNSLRIKQKEFKARGISAWITPSGPTCTVLD